MACYAPGKIAKYLVSGDIKAMAESVAFLWLNCDNLAVFKSILSAKIFVWSFGIFLSSFENLG